MAEDRNSGAGNEGRGFSDKPRSGGNQGRSGGFNRKPGSGSYGNRGQGGGGYGGRRDGDRRGRGGSQGPRRDGDGRWQDRKPRRDGARDGEFKPRGEFRRDQDGRGSRPDRDRRDGEFKPRRYDDRGPRREGDRQDRPWNRDNRDNRDNRGDRRDGDFKPRRDGDRNWRDDRGPRRDGERRQYSSRQDEERKARQAKHRSGGQFRKRDESEAPIQRSLTGAPVPVRVERKPVTTVVKPDFPYKEDWPEVPRRLLMEMEETARESEIKEIGVAVMLGTEAFEEGDLDRAMAFFSWAKTRATRSVTIREGLGICHYIAGDFEQAQRELQTYMRLSGRQEHNHIIADCARATGNGERVPELIEAMIDAWKADPAYFDVMNVLEGLIVLAGYWLEDRDQPERALAAITQIAFPEDDDITESHLRLWHVQARAARAAGDEAGAQAALDEIKAVNPEWLEAMDRWIAGEDIDDILEPWAKEVELPEEYRQKPHDDTVDDLDDDDLDDDLVNDGLQADARDVDLVDDRDGDRDDDRDGEAGSADDHAERLDADGTDDLADDLDDDDHSWDPGDDWDDEDWDEEITEVGTPIGPEWDDDLGQPVADPITVEPTSEPAVEDTVDDVTEDVIQDVNQDVLDDAADDVAHDVIDVDADTEATVLESGQGREVGTPTSDSPDVEAEVVDVGAADTVDTDRSAASDSTAEEVNATSQPSLFDDGL